MNLNVDAHPHLSQELEGFSQNDGEFLIRIEGRFESSHYLYSYMPDGGDEPMHGHSWLIQVSLAHAKKSIQENGICFDFLAVRNRFDQLIERIDHICINNLKEFHNINPTTENIARWFYQGLLKVTSSCEGKIKEIHLYEGPGNLAVFKPSP